MEEPPRGSAEPELAGLITGPAYALTSLVSAYEEGRTGTAQWLEPAIMLGVLSLLAVLIRG